MINVMQILTSRGGLVQVSAEDVQLLDCESAVLGLLQQGSAWSGCWTRHDTRVSIHAEISALQHELMMDLNSILNVLPHKLCQLVDTGNTCKHINAHIHVYSIMRSTWYFWVNALNYMNMSQSYFPPPSLPPSLPLFPSLLCSYSQLHSSLNPHVSCQSHSPHINYSIRGLDISNLFRQTPIPAKNY